MPPRGQDLASQRAALGKIYGLTADVSGSHEGNNTGSVPLREVDADRSRVGPHRKCYCNSS